MAPVGLTRWQESLLFAELGRGAVSPGFQGPLQSENTEAEPCRGDASCVSRGQAPGPEVTPRSPEGREQTMAAFRPAAVARRGEERVWAKAGRRGEAAVRGRTPGPQPFSPLHLPARG